MVVLYNHSSVDYHVEKGAKIAQLICELCIQPSIKVITSDSELPSDSSNPHQPTMATERGAGGFGSTGY